MDRRSFLRGSAITGMGMSLGLGTSFWSAALASPAQPGPGPYGPLLHTPDPNGLLLPEGFQSRIVAVAGELVPGTSYTWHWFPDGAGCFPTPDGGWIYVSNSEVPFPIDGPTPPPPAGSVGAIRFGPDGSALDAYPILQGTSTNCAGGVTPWGTWLSCEEWEVIPGSPFGYTAGSVWECDPTGATPAVERLALGRYKHEMAAVDPHERRIYLSEDLPDGRLYRFTPARWPELSEGLLEAMLVDSSGRVSWVAIPDPSSEHRGPLRRQVPQTTPFNRGEGCVYDDGRVYLATTADDRVWVHDIAAGTMSVLYDAAAFADPVLTGVDNIIASAAHDVYVAEDGGNMEAVIITPDLQVAPVLRVVDPTSTGFRNPSPIPTDSEITGLAFSPDGNRLYFSSQRGRGLGITYEVTGPWRGGTLAGAPSAPGHALGPGDPGPQGPGATQDAAAAQVAGEGAARPGSARPAAALPETGANLPPLWLGAGAALAGLAAWRARRLAEGQGET